MIETILDRHGRDSTRLLQILIEVQEAAGWLAPGAVTATAQGLGLSRAHVEGVAGFYSFLHTEPPGHYRVLFADNITDRMLGNRALLEALCRDLWVEEGRVSADGRVFVGTTSCTGMCDQGPAALVNGRPVTRLDPERVARIGAMIRDGTPLEQWPSEFFAVEDRIHRRDRLLATTVKPGEALEAALGRGPRALLERVAHAKLRGRGGAGFPTATKWEACRAASADWRTVVCNADEGEPGTFKDRVLLSSYPDLVFEGMTLAAYAVGASRGFLYLRGEYRHLLEPLRAVVERRRADGLLGAGILGRTGFDFDIEIHLGAGAYICGEESALIESLEGKRGTPRIRPPFPVTRGYLGRPTVVNNVETLAAAALVALRGGEWFAETGTDESTGTKVLSISGDCARPGIYEYPFGVTVAEVLADCGAEDVRAVQVGGASGVCLAPDEFHRRLAFEDVPGAGAFMVFDATRDLFEVARNFVHFFAHESCGFCTPCRVGTGLLRGLMEKFHGGHAAEHDLAEMEWVGRMLKTGSHCGLGSTAPNAFFDTVAKFRPAYERRMTARGFAPAFDLDDALAAARRATGRDDPGAHLENLPEGRS